MTAPTFKMKFPNANETIVAHSGNSYTADANGIAVGVAGNDLADLMAAGAEHIPGLQVRDNVAATAGPGVTADSASNYGVGSLWIDITGAAVYFCVDATAGAAVWKLSSTTDPSATTINAGQAGTAGVVNIYPATSGKGKIHMTAADASAAYDTNIVNAAMGQAVTLTIPDPGNSTASYVLTKGTQTISGNRTQSGSFNVTGQLSANSVVIPAAATIALAAGATNSIDVTITVKDSAGATINAVQDLEVYLCDSADGSGVLTAATLSGNLTASTGTILTALTAKKHVIATTVGGVLVLNLVASGKPAGVYFVVKGLGGSIVVSAASGTNWGA